MRTISIIIPTFERPVELTRILASIEKNTYPMKEIIVVDDNSQDKGMTRTVVEMAKRDFKTNILYLNTDKDGYNLALARNMGVNEAMGEIIMFLDDRYELDPDVLEKASHAGKEIWYYGKKRVKGEIIHDRPFIENFSWLLKSELRRFGPFNERISMYGGMSQDVRERCNALGLRMVQENVVATEITRSKSNKNKDQIWRAKYLLYKLNH